MGDEQQDTLRILLWGEDILSRRLPGVHRNRAAFKHRAISRMETQPMIRMKIT